MMSFTDACRRWRPRVTRAVPSASDDFIDELTAHIAQRWLDMRAAGRGEAEANEAAEQDLRAWLRVSPPPRDPPRRPLTGAAADLRHAWRQVAWRPGFALSVMLLVAIAVATTTSVTAVVYGVLFRPLPYPEEDRLAVIWQRERGAVGQVSFPDYTDLRASGVFDLVAALGGGRGTFSGGVTTERVNALDVEPAAFTMLGATPVLGRLLDQTDMAQPVAMISHRLWLTQFGAAPDAVGRTFSLSGRTLTIVGVLQAGFDFELPVASTFLLENHDVWLPFDAGDLALRREVTTYEVLARLAPGVSREGAQAAVSTVAARLASTHPATNADRTFEVVGLRDHVVSSARRPLLLMAGGAMILVIAALANLGALVLARFAARRGELAVRAALGATRSRLTRQLMTEHAVLAGVGGVGGGLAGWLGTRMLTTAEALNLPRPDAVVFDATVLAAGVACGLTIIALLSWLPLRSEGTDTQARVAGRSSARPRRLLVAAEVAIALILCTTAALVSLTLIRLLSLNPGFSASNRITMRISAYAARHPGKGETIGFFNELLARSSALPGVVRSAAGSSLPLSGQFSGTGVLADRASATPPERQSAGWQFVTPGYFATTGTPIVNGRDFVAREIDHAPHVSVINETLSRALFGDDDPIGRRILSGGGEDWHTVIGVVADVRHRSLAETPSPRVYDLAGQHWGRTMYVVVETKGSDPALTVRDVRRVVASLDPDAPIFEVATVEALRARSVATERLAARIAAAVALVSLLLALVGVHAVVACSVAERLREMGVRLALGASPRAIFGLVLGEAAAMAVTGAIAGMMGSIFAATLLTRYLYGVNTTQIAQVIGVTVLAVIAAALTAALNPGWRAASVDPLSVIRDASA